MEDKLYRETASIVQKVVDQQSSLRSLIFSSKFQKKKQLLRLACSTLKYRTILEQILAQIPELLQDYAFNSEQNPHLVSVLLFEFLFGSHGLKCERKFRNALERRRQEIGQLKERLIEEGLLDKNGDIPEKNNSIVLPRYVRINSLQSDLGTTCKKLKRSGWHLINANITSRKKFRSVASSLLSHQFLKDPHLDNLLVFPKGTDFHNHELKLNGMLILQDKASCLAALCLAPPSGSHVIDACAAPGIKTSHLAAIMQNKGRIFAFDLNADRVAVMEDLLATSGVEIASVQCQDFLKVDTTLPKFAKVSHVLVDPPCSGSGIVSRLDSLTDGYQNKSSRRLASLANLQAMLLKKALRIPSVQKVVYSTCSVSDRENEMVLGEILGEEEFSREFEMCCAMGAWKHRGKKGFEFGRFCLRSSAEKDLTNGFFVAVLQRKMSSE